MWHPLHSSQLPVIHAQGSHTNMQAEKLSYDVESLKAHNQLLTYRLEALQVR